VDEQERRNPAYISLTREERRLVLEIAAAENRDLRRQLKEFVDEGIERRQRLMRMVRQPVTA
jgi:hypothetical protein